MSVRALLRLPFVTLACFLASGTMVAARPLVWIAPRLQLAIRNAAFRWWGRTLCRIMGLRVEVEAPPTDGHATAVARVTLL